MQNILKITLNLFKRWHIIVCKLHEIDEQINKSVSQVSLWHHLAEPRASLCQTVNLNTSLSMKDF